MNDTKAQADLIRRDLGHASRRREHALALRRMAGWIRMSPEAETIAVVVPEHVSRFGSRHKRRELKLDNDQLNAFAEYLDAEADRFDGYAESIEKNLVGKSGDGQ